jgi:hypothetical protein
MKRIINNTMLVKQTNVELVTSVLRELGQATRAEIASATGLSVATCGNIIRELLQSGEIWEGDLLESGGGRPSRQFIYNANYSLALCISVMSDRKSHMLDFAVVNLLGQIIEKGTARYDSITFETIDTLIQDAVEKHKAIRAIGIGIPGMVRDGVVKYCDTEALNGIAIKSILQSKYNVEVLVENEMHLMVYGYYKNNPMIDGKSLAIVFAPENHLIGAGFIINGQILKGDSNLAGEINYLPSGLTREELLKQSNSAETFIPIIVRSIASIIPIINPAYLVLTGYLFKPEMLDLIKKQCGEIIPEEFLPQFLFHQDLGEDYLKGIISLTLETITGGIQLLRSNSFE